MSFLGSIAGNVRQVLANHAASINLPVLIIGAGNFTTAAALRAGGYTGRIYCCDVSLYTSVLGAYLSDGKLLISENQDCPEQLSGLFRGESLLDIAASVSLLYDLREVWKMSNPYQVRVVEQYRAKWDDLLQATKKKLEIYKASLSPLEYEARDGFDVLEKSDPAAHVIAFPPTYSKGYERLEKLLRASLTWEAPPYREMTDKATDLYELISRFDGYFVVLEKNLPEVHRILGEPAAVLPRGRAGFSHVIIKSPEKKIVLRRTIKSQDIGPFLLPEYEITGHEMIGFTPISLGQSIRLNELFLSARIDYFTGGVGVSLAFHLDGRIFGKVDFCPSSHQWNLPSKKDRNTVSRGYDGKWQKLSKQIREENPICMDCKKNPSIMVHHKNGDTSQNDPENLIALCYACHGVAHASDNSMIYIMSDLAVPSCEPRLAKLILYCLLSREIRELLNLKYIEDFTWACTTAFSPNPASMKYRGVFTKHKTKKVENGFLINYFAPFSNKPLTDQFKAWLKKYKKITIKQ
jgi:hypothetical protein